MGEQNKNENAFDYKSLYQYVITENQRLREDAKKLNDKINELACEAAELEDAVDSKNGEITALKMEFNSLREQNARLFGEVCGLKFGMRCREAFTAKTPREEIDDYEY